MLPTPHGPTDAPVPAGTGDEAVDTGRTPDEGALLRVVEHLADVPDGDPEDAPPGDDAPADATEPTDATERDDERRTDDAPVDEADDDAPVDRSADDATTDDPQAPADADADGTTGTEGESPVDAAVATTDHDTVANDDTATEDARTDAVGPVAAALSDTSHTIDDLNPAEQVFLAQQRSMIVGLCEDPSDPELVSALFDRVRAQWALVEDRPDLRPLAEAFGVALGDLVRARAPHLEWAAYSDRHGTEIVLARREPEMVVYPVAAVAQNWQEASPGWLLRHVTTVVQGVSPQLSSSDA